MKAVISNDEVTRIKMQGSYEVLKGCKKVGHFPAWESGKKCFHFGLLILKKEIIFQT